MKTPYVKQSFNMTLTYCYQQLLSIFLFLLIFANKYNDGKINLDRLGLQLQLLLEIEEHGEYFGSTLVYALTKAEGTSKAPDDSDSVFGISAELEQDWGKCIPLALQLQKNKKQKQNIKRGRNRPHLVSSYDHQ